MNTLNSEFNTLLKKKLDESKEYIIGEINKLDVEESKHNLYLAYSKLNKIRIESYSKFSGELLDEMYKIIEKYNTDNYQDGIVIYLQFDSEISEFFYTRRDNYLESL
ncbi:hypothetical protein [Galbibacter orientalis]|uniref:hypothetical protein n=1 Tax=Galbibacter orientalis TaxID=453852 RepID=UPI0030806966